MKRILLAAFIAGAMAGTAAAADDSMYADMAGAAHDWSGSYLGLQIGGGFGDSRIFAVGGGSTTGNFDIDGVIGGYTTGYNWQNGNWVFGIETDTSLSGIEGRTPTACATTCFTEIDWLSTYRIRIGSAMDNVLPYVTGGVALGGASAGVTGISKASDTRFGWAAGAGIEVALDNDWSIKGEYLHVDLGDFNFVAPPLATVEVDDINIVRLGVDRKFDIFGFLGF